MSKIPKKVLRDIYELHSIIQDMQSTYWNDRGDRARIINELAERGKLIGQKIIDSQDPL